MGDYFPQDDQDQKAWIGQFLNALPTYGTQLGLTAPEVTALTTAGNNASGAITQFTGAEAAYEAAMADRKTLVGTFNTVLRPLVRRMKTSGTYTPTIGETLGVVGENTPVDPTLIKPSFSITVHMGFVRLRIRRNGASSVAVYCRRVGEVNWNLCDRATRATFEDTEPLHTPGVPEVREYIVQGYMGDTAVGIQSDPKVVVFAGAIAA